MAVLFGPATFPGADYSPLPAGWSTPRTTTGAYSAQVGSNMRLHAGSLTGYTGKVGVRPTGLSVADARMRCWFRLLFNQDGALRMLLRADANLNEQSGYVLAADKAAQRLYLAKVVGYAYATLAYVDYTLATDAQHEVDFGVVGNAITAWVWPSGTPKPTSPTFSRTDTSLTAPGAVAWMLVGGAGADMQADVGWGLTVTDGSGDLLLTGSVAPSGVLLKRIPKTLAGSIEPSGAVMTMRVVLQTLTGVVAPFGTFVHAIPRIFTGATAPTGVVVKQTNKVLAGQVTSSGRFAKAALRTFAGTVTPVGVLTATWIGRIAGVPGKVAMTIRASAWARLRIRGRDADTDAG